VACWFRIDCKDVAVGRGLTAVGLIGLVAAIVAAIAEPAARNALVDRLAFELVVGTGVH